MRPARPGGDGRASVVATARRWAAGAVAVAVALSATAGAAQDGSVAVSDLLRLRVLDWDALTGAVVEWPSVSGDYIVGPDGAIAVPFAGRIPSAGRRSDEVAADVVEGLRNRLALVEPPDVTVEVASSRPVVVTGDVRSPGPYDFVPGLLAIQAVALAGGAGPSAGSDAAIRREVTSAQTTLATLRSQELRQLARQARLEAELAGADTITVASPPTGADWPAVLALEEQLLQVRRDRLARELTAISEQSQLFEAEIEALERKNETLTEQLALASEAAANAESLASQGLVGNQRLFDSAQVRASIENQLLDVSTSILTARQSIASADRERIGLQDARTAEILEQRQEVDGLLTEVRARIAGQLALLAELDAGTALLGAGEPEVAVLRPEDGRLLRIEDASLVPLQPGDVVEVTEPELTLGAEPLAARAVPVPGAVPDAVAAPAPSGEAAAPPPEPVAEQGVEPQAEPGAAPGRMPASSAPAEDDEVGLVAPIDAVAPLAAEASALQAPAPSDRTASSNRPGGVGPQVGPAQASVPQEVTLQGVAAAPPPQEAAVLPQDAVPGGPRMQPMTEPPSVSPVARPG